MPDREPVEKDCRWFPSGSADPQNAGFVNSCTNNNAPHEAARRKKLRLLAGLALALLAGILFSISLGRFPVPIGEVVKILLSRVFPIEPTWAKNMEIAVLNVRLPRILLACMVGCCLSCAGVSYQSIFHNAMAAPDILGASSGACFGAALGILLRRGSAVVTLLAFAFSLTTVAVVYLIGMRARGSRIVGILLAGLTISSLFTAGTSYIKLAADPSDQLPAITYWLMGSLSGVTMKEVLLAGIPMLIGGIVLFLLRWRINLLSLDDGEAQSMGVNIARMRLIVILCATLLTASSVAVSGSIGWVGLIVPHICRRLAGNDCRVLLPSSMLFGAIFLLIVDDLSRNLLATEIPIGILTAFVGAPFFIYLMTRKDVDL